jgi:hypothetical protein
MARTTLSIAKFALRPAMPFVRLIGYCIGVFAAAALAGPAAGEIYSSDSGIEISGTGSRMSRNCTVLLKPTQTFGDNLAPRLTLVTSGASRLSFGVDGPAQYSNLVVVQNNVRRPLVGTDNASVEQFRLSDIGKALKLQQLFFITAQRSDSGKYVSSRYERIDLDAILVKIESACPFDAESLMTDLSSRERTERALSIPSSDLTLIRWVLSRKYAGSSSKPEPGSSLSQQERTYLKRYAGDNAFPLSQYLTAETARKLIAEGQLIANLATPVPTPTPTPSPTPAPREFHVYDGTDFEGDDIKPWLMNFTLDGCRSACIGYAGCRAFTFNKPRSVCILKTGSGRPRPNPNAISASMTPVSISIVRLTILNGVDLPGGDLEARGLKDISLDQCSDFCLNNQFCAGFSYIKSKSWCWMKRQILDRRPNSDVVSGVK